MIGYLLTGPKTSPDFYQDIELLRQFGNVRVLMPNEERYDLQLLIINTTADITPASSVCYSGISNLPSIQESLTSSYLAHWMLDTYESFMQIETPMLFFNGGFNNLLAHLKQKAKLNIFRNSYNVKVGEKRIKYSLNSYYFETLASYNSLRPLGNSSFGLPWSLQENLEENVHIIKTLIGDYENQEPVGVLA